jgi:hypothetical protein
MRQTLESCLTLLLQGLAQGSGPLSRKTAPERFEGAADIHEDQSVYPKNMNNSNDVVRDEADARVACRVSHS